MCGSRTTATLGDSVALEADDWLFEKLEGAAQDGLTQDALEAVARWKYRGGALRKLVKENEALGNQRTKDHKEVIRPRDE